MSCNPLSPDAYKYLVRSPLASPFAFQWIRAHQREEGDIGTVDYVSGPATGTAGRQNQNGAVIHFGSNRLGQNPPLGKWHHISIEVDGELMTPVDDPPLLAPEVQSRGNLSSLLKARITLAMGTSRERCFDFDIGAGVEFDVACYAVQKLEVLIPDPRVVIPDPPPPIGVDPGPLQLATVLTPTIYFTPGSARQHNPLTYTVPVVITATEAEWFIPRVKDSTQIKGGTDAIPTFGTPGITIEFIYVPTQLVATTPTAPAAYFVLDEVSLPTFGSAQQTPLVFIPGNCNAFRITRTLPGARTVANIMQILNV